MQFLRQPPDVTKVFFALLNSDWRWKHVSPLSFHQRCCSLVGEPHSGRFWTCSAVRLVDACWCCWDTPPYGLGWPETVGVSGSLTVELQTKRNTDTVPRINSIKSSYIISFFPHRCCYAKSRPCLLCSCLVWHFLKTSQYARADYEASDQLDPPAAHQTVVQCKHRHPLLTSNQPWELFTVCCPWWWDL